METTHWADWAETFKLQDAACLIAGVSPAKEMVAWADKLPPEARPAFKKLWDSYLRGTGFYKRPGPDSADFPKMLHGIPSEDLWSPTVVPARGAIRRREMLVAPSAELIRERMENVRVSRAELHRWVRAMGIKSVYQFSPVGTLAHVPGVDTHSAGQAAPIAPLVNAPAQTIKIPAPGVTGGEWVTQAQRRAREIIKDCREHDRYPSQENLGDTIAAEFRKAGTVGADGKPLSGATIKRHALRGISSAVGKQLSTSIGRGK